MAFFDVKVELREDTVPDNSRDCVESQEGESEATFREMVWCARRSQSKIQITTGLSSKFERKERYHYIDCVQA